MNKVLKTHELFDLSKTIAKELFKSSVYPWDVLDGIDQFITELGNTLDCDKFDRVGENVWIAKDATVADSACIIGPCIIDCGAEVRQCAYIRGKAIIGKGAVVGNSCEIKNAVLFDSVQVPHFNYVGDSVLGYKAHMGAGSVTSNVKSDKTPVCVKSDGECVQTERKKLGAMLGDFVEVGCNSVLCPGSIVGRNSNVYPLSLVRGVVPENSIFKGERGITPKT